MQTNLNPIEKFNINVTLVADLQHPDEGTDDALDGSYGNNFETKTYVVSRMTRREALESFYNIHINVDRLKETLEN